MSKLFDIYLKALPFLIVILTTIGYIHLTSYYYFFSINIIHFIDISEIPLLFINTSLLLLSAVLVVVVKSLQIIKKDNDDQLLFEAKLTSIEDIRLQQSLKTERNLKSNKSTKSIFIKMRILAITLIVIGIAIGLIFKNYFVMSILVIFGLFTLLFFKKTVNLFHYEQQKIQTEYFFLFFSIIYLCVTSLVTIPFQIKKSYDIKFNDKKIIDTNFSYSNIIIKTNDSLKFVGETRNYIFLYDLAKKESLIYEKEKVTNRKIIK